LIFEFLEKGSEIMWGNVLKVVGRQAVHKAVAHQAKRGKLNPRLGLALLRDKRVPFGVKFKAVVLALMGMLCLNILEIPAEMILMVALPMLGVPINIAWNGLENIVGPILLTALLLPFLAPKEIVEPALMVQDGSVIDVEHHAPPPPPPPRPPA
jgi:hypothetical protein